MLGKPKSLILMSGHRPDRSIALTRVFAIRDVCKVALVPNHVQETYLASILKKRQQNHNWAQLSTADQTKHVPQWGLHLVEQRLFNQIGTEKWRVERKVENQATRGKNVQESFSLKPVGFCDSFLHFLTITSNVSSNYSTLLRLPNKYLHFYKPHLVIGHCTGVAWFCHPFVNFRDWFFHFLLKALS